MVSDFSLLLVNVSVQLGQIMETNKVGLCDTTVFCVLRLGKRHVVLIVIYFLS